MHFEEIMAKLRGNCAIYIERRKLTKKEPCNRSSSTIIHPKK